VLTKIQFYFSTSCLYNPPPHVCVPYAILQSPPPSVSRCDMPIREIHAPPKLKQVRKKQKGIRVILKRSLNCFFKSNVIKMIAEEKSWSRAPAEPASRQPRYVSTGSRRERHRRPSAVSCSCCCERGCACPCELAACPFACLGQWTWLWAGKMCSPGQYRCPLRERR
jgi:hypothetical protein